MKTTTLIGTPDPSSIRRDRLTWVASTLLLPLGNLVQAYDVARRLYPRSGVNRDVK